MRVNVLHRIFLRSEFLYATFVPNFYKSLKFIFIFHSKLFLRTLHPVEFSQDGSDEQRTSHFFLG